MKINKSNRLNKKGMTLIEISLVVALLLSLIAILFLGIAAYKKGVDRSKCVVIISSIQKAVRSHANMFELAIGAALLILKSLELGNTLKRLLVPQLEAYTYTDDVPVVGTAYTTCDDVAVHAPSDTSGW